MSIGRQRDGVPARWLAWRNLRRTPLRSGLSVLAILVGVVAVASLGMAGATLERSAVETLGEVGGDVIVSPTAASGTQTLTTRDLSNIRRSADGAAVISVRSKSVRLTRGRKQIRTVAYRVDHPMMLFDLKSGRSRGLPRTGVLVGNDLAQDLDVRAGNTIRVGNRTQRVRGVLAEVGPLAPVSPDRAVVVLDNERPQSGPSQVIVRASSGDTANHTARLIRSRLNGRTNRVSVVAMVQIRRQIGALFEVVDDILLGIGGISLGVGGLGILNVMLLSVAERRPEIGLLRAVGFRKRDVLSIVLWEAALLGLAGVSIGVVVSLGIGLVLNAAVQSDPLAVADPSTLAHLGRAAAVGMVVSVGGGLYPAWKAATERPVEALRG